MLESLHVKNLALIKEAELELNPGLNVLSGETGAGKSLLLGSINLALGKRADADLIRNGEDSAFVELTFKIREKELQEKLTELGFPPDEEDLIISRRISDGRSRSRINGETVTLSSLKKVTELLIDIHGQHDHQSLLKEENHLKVLDHYGKEELKDVKARYEESYKQYLQIRDQIRKMGGDDESRKQRLDFLDFQIKEIEEAGLKKGEEKQLDELYNRLSHSENVKNALEKLILLLRENAVSAVSESLKEASSVTVFDESIKSIESQLLDIDAYLSDTIREAEHILDLSDVDEELLKKTEERLELLSKLKKKYGHSEEEILKHLKDLQAEYRELLDFDKNKEKIEKDLEKEKEILKKAAKELSEKRQEVGERFSKALEKALTGLNFLHVSFETSVSHTNHYTSSGADEVRFLISTNPGEERKPLSQVASGGELSRIMLAIKSLAADADEIPTLIFDEIDQGISGKTAAAVAREMQKISVSHQVICISHLPQIVSSADENYLIEKSVEDQKTVTRITALSEENTLKEIARMLGSGEVTPSNMQNAAEMKAQMRRKSS